MSQAVIVNPTGKPLDPTGTINVPADLIPSFRVNVAIESKVEKNLLVKLTGGIGDNICAEPSIRFAINRFKDCNVSIAYEFPELFQHLALKHAFNMKKDKIDYSKFLVFDSFQPNGHLANEFIKPPFIHCVDYVSLNLWCAQLPMADKCVKLIPSLNEYEKADNLLREKDVVIHPGRTWPSRTLPKDWWDVVLHTLVQSGARPVLIGEEVLHDEQPRGTVDVNTEGCLDLRNKLTLMESVAVTKTVQVVLTNDSAPLHFAASGNAWIGFLSTVRHPEIITHYRNGGEFGWRMQNFAKGGHWETFSMAPATGSLRMDLVRQSQMRAWLPEPRDVAAWALGKLHLVN